MPAVLKITFAGLSHGFSQLRILPFHFCGADLDELRLNSDVSSNIFRIIVVDPNVIICVSQLLKFKVDTVDAVNERNPVIL